MKKHNLSRKKFSKRVSKNLRKLSKKVGRKVGGRRIKQKKSQKRTKGRKMKKRTRKNRQRGGSASYRREYRKAEERDDIDDYNKQIMDTMNDFFDKKGYGGKIRFEGGYDENHREPQYYRDTLDKVNKAIALLETFLAQKYIYNQTQKILLIDGANILRDWCNKGLSGKPRDDCTGLRPQEKAELLEKYQLSHYGQIIATYKKDNQQKMLTQGTSYQDKILELSFAETEGPIVEHGADDLCILAIAAILQYELRISPINRTLGRKLSYHERKGYNAAGNRGSQYQLKPGIYLATGDKMNHVDIYINDIPVTWNQNSGGTHPSDGGGYGGGYGDGGAGGGFGVGGAGGAGGAGGGGGGRSGGFGVGGAGGAGAGGGYGYGGAGGAGGAGAGAGGGYGYGGAGGAGAGGAGGGEYGGGGFGGFGGGYGYGGAGAGGGGGGGGRSGGFGGSGRWSSYG